MLTVYWAAKGGSGATVVAAADAVVSARHRPVLLVDLDGDLPHALGIDVDPEVTPGVGEWLAAGSEVPADALERLARPVGDDLWLLPRGRGPLTADRAGVLGRILADAPRDVVVDAGTRPGTVGVAMCAAADRSVLVTRPCYLAMRRALESALAPTDVVLVREAQRALRDDDVRAALGAPVRVTIPVDATIARAVDAGLLRARLPRRLERALSGSTSHPAVPGAAAVVR